MCLVGLSELSQDAAAYNRAALISSGFSDVLTGTHARTNRYGYVHCHLMKNLEKDVGEPQSHLDIRLLIQQKTASLILTVISDCFLV